MTPEKNDMVATAPEKAVGACLILPGSLGLNNLGILNHSFGGGSLLLETNEFLRYDI